MKFDIKKYRKRKVVMHCSNLAEAKNFCEYLHQCGQTWSGNISYKYLGCLDWIADGTICYDFNQGQHGTLADYIKEGFQILHWSDYVKCNITKADLKTGMIVETNDNLFYLVLRDTEFGDILKRIDNNQINLYWSSLDDFDDNLKHYSTEIINIYTAEAEHQLGIPATNTLIWTRNNTTELTITEIEEKLGIKNLKIIKENND